TLDGQPVEWLRTDGFIIGVPIPPGEHTLTLTYRPPRWLLGLGVSSMAWVLWCGGLFWAWRNRGREETHAA
ncbi:MAG: hypothetical protein D6802_01920, partial [Ardenticatenia bacterium]